MDDIALSLARLRAARGTRIDPEQRRAAASRAAAVGRRLVDLGGGRVALAWDDGAVPEPGEGLRVHRLSPLPLVTFTVCLRLCWPDSHADPYPGEPTSRTRVLDVLARLGVDLRHGKAALNHELPATGLIKLDGEAVRLGAAAACWPGAHVALLRRAHYRLPTAGAAP